MLVERAPAPAAPTATPRARKLAHLIKSLIGVSAAVRVVQSGGIERSLGKAKRVVDKRPKALNVVAGGRAA